MLLPGIVGASMNRHMARYMNGAQKGTGRNTRAARTGLLVDRVLNVSHMDARTGAFINLMRMW